MKLIILLFTLCSLQTIYSMDENSIFFIAPTHFQEINYLWQQAGFEPVDFENLGVDSIITIKGHAPQKPLLYSVRQGKEHVVRVLLENRANPDSKDKQGWLPIFHAIYLYCIDKSENRKNIFRLLAQYADLSKTGDLGFRQAIPLEYALYREELSEYDIELLIKRTPKELLRTLLSDDYKYMDSNKKYQERLKKILPIDCVKE